MISRLFEELKEKRRNADVWFSHAQKEKFNAENDMQKWGAEVKILDKMIATLEELYRQHSICERCEKPLKAQENIECQECIDYLTEEDKHGHHP